MPLTVGLCGLGTAALRAHLPALSRAEEAGAIRLVGVCDPDPGRCAEVSARTQGAGAHLDVEDLLERASPSLLVVASPPSAHVGAIEAAAVRGVDVLCEKPLGIRPGDREELDEIVAAHQGLLLATVHQYRHAAGWRAVARVASAATAAGERWRLHFEVERPGTDPLAAGGWRAAGDREGGILGDHAVHYLALCWGLDPGCRVTASHRSGSPGQETASVRLALAGGDALIDVSYAGERRRNLVALEVPGRRLTVRWEDGLLTLTSPRRRLERRLGALSDRQYVNDLYVGLYEELISALPDAAARGRLTAETLGVAALLSEALDLHTA